MNTLLYIPSDAYIWLRYSTLVGVSFPLRIVQLLHALEAWTRIIVIQDLQAAAGQRAYKCVTDRAEVRA